MNAIPMRDINSNTSNGMNARTYSGSSCDTSSLNQSPVSTRFETQAPVSNATGDLLNSVSHLPGKNRIWAEAPDLPTLGTTKRPNRDLQALMKSFQADVEIPLPVSFKSIATETSFLHNASETDLQNFRAMFIPESGNYPSER